MGLVGPFGLLIFGKVWWEKSCQLCSREKALWNLFSAVCSKNCLFVRQKCPIVNGSPRIPRQSPTATRRTWRICPRPWSLHPWSRRTTMWALPRWRLRPIESGHRLTRQHPLVWRIIHWVQGPFSRWNRRRAFNGHGVAAAARRRSLLPRRRRQHHRRSVASRLPRKRPRSSNRPPRPNRKRTLPRSSVVSFRPMRRRRFWTSTEEYDFPSGVVLLGCLLAWLIDWRLFRFRLFGRLVGRLIDWLHPSQTFCFSFRYSFSSSFTGILHVERSTPQCGYAVTLTLSSRPNSSISCPERMTLILRNWLTKSTANRVTTR